MSTKQERAVTTQRLDPRGDFGSPIGVVDLVAFDSAVADVLAETDAAREHSGAEGAERVLARRLAEPELAAVLAATPAGADATTSQLLRHLREQRTTLGRSQHALVRTLLLSQIDVVWWGHIEPYRTDADVLGTPDLVDLAGPLRAGRLGFRYRMQPTNLAARLGRAAQRRVWPGRRPHTAGLRFSRARPQLVALLNRVAYRFSTVAPAGTPPLWITSLARSVEHQDRLRALGYYAAQHSAHCIGYAADVAMSWYRRFGADRALAGILLERRAAGDLNVIDEGEVWHVCLHPDTAARLAADGARIGG
jgi:hypothetical protein